MMPHAIIEYSSTIADLFQKIGGSKLVHETLIASGVFKPENLKTRAYEANDFLVGLQGDEGSFLHVTVYLLEGRDMATKATVSEALLAELQKHFATIGQVSVDVRDLAKDCYRKFAA